MFLRGEKRCVAAAGTVLAWLTGASHRSRVKTINGLARRCGSQEGNALAVCCRLGLADDPRVQLLAESLVEWQWPDGGWNCDKNATGRRSSFNESLAPMWGLHEYWTGRPETSSAARRQPGRRSSSSSTGSFGSVARGSRSVPRSSRLHYPPYWHYDILQALLVLSRMGLASDPRGRGRHRAASRNAASLTARWRAGGRWWKPPGANGGNVEVVDWGRSGQSEMVTLNALRVLHAAK